MRAFGYVAEASELNLADVRKQKVDELEIMEKKAMFFQIFSTELKSFDGKKITRRLVTKIESMTDEYTISFSREKRWGNEVTISIWTANGYDNRFSFTFKGDEPFDYAKFEESQKYWFKGVYETIENTEKILRNCSNIVSNYNKKVKAFNDALAELNSACKTLN